MAALAPSSREEELAAARSFRRLHDERDRMEEAAHRNESRRRTPGSLQSLLFSGIRGIHEPSARHEMPEFLREMSWDFSNRRNSLDIPRTPLPLVQEPLTQPPPCSFLRPGMRFKGDQCARRVDGSFEHVWRSKVTLHSCNHEKGTLTGSIEADLPESPVVTFFTGEIIDNINNSFYNQSHLGWPNTASMDLHQWRRLPGFDRKLLREVRKCGGRAPSLAEDESRLFMRWKEQSFVQGGECQLTIAGFYIVSLSRKSGEIHALYIDPNCTPGQRLRLKVVSDTGFGVSFPAVDLA